MALINQKYGRQGNANYVFYKLAQKSGASCTSSTSEATSCIFNDVTVGTNEGACTPGTPDCLSNGEAYGVMSGYSAGSGYDLATGLGSVNANNLVNAWSTVTTLPSTTTLSNVSPIAVTHGQPVSFTVAVKPQTGSGTPTGIVSLAGPATGTSKPGIGAFSLSGGSVTASTDLLPGGSYSLTAHYPGDATYSASDSGPISVTVNKENSQPQAFLVTFNSSNNVVSYNTNTAQYGSPYILRVNVDNAAGQLCAPVATSGATACPTGTVAMTNNGSTLDAGTFTLNSYGYFEDLTVQLPGGTNSVKSAYAGDNSFNASTGTNAITITPASTTLTLPIVGGAAVGQSVQISVSVNTASSGVAPTGTVTFYANGTALGGTVSYSPVAGGSGGPAYVLATLISNTNAFTASGNYAITATYNGDANYSPSTSNPTTVTVIYPAPNLVVTPNSQTVSYGGTATIAALVDTTNKTVYPTGTLTFTDANSGTAIAGPITCANAKDTSGNFACQAVITFTVTSGDPIAVSYSGDANYPSSSSWAYITMPDFNFSASGWVQVNAGQSQSLTVTFTSVNGLSGTAGNFGCSSLPAETTCSFSPAQVTLPSNGTASVTLTVTTTALGQSRKGLGFADKRARNWGISGFGLVLGACLIGIPRSRQRGRRVLVALTLSALLILLPSCGGGSGGGGGVQNPVPSITSLSPTQIAAGSQVNLLYINGANFISSSTVTYNGTLHNSSLQSPTQLEVALGPNDVATTGQYPVVVTNPTPGGGSSAPVNFDIVTGTPTGYFTANMTATIGPIAHSAQLSMQIQ
jgi:hypothetical protein